MFVDADDFLYAYTMTSCVNYDVITRAFERKSSAINAIKNGVAITGHMRGYLTLWKHKAHETLEIRHNLLRNSIEYFLYITVFLKFLKYINLST